MSGCEAHRPHAGHWWVSLRSTHPTAMCVRRVHGPHTAATDCDYIPRQPVPTARGVSRASRGAGRAAVADAGRLTRVSRRRPKPHGSGAPFRAPLGFHWRRRRAWSERRQSAVWSPSAVDSNGQSTGGHAEQAYKHRARDAGQPANPAATTPVCFPTIAHRAAGFAAPAFRGTCQ